MALKQLMLKNKIYKKKTELAALREKDGEFTTRETALEEAITEAQTEEEQATVEEAVTAFEAEKQAHEDEKARLEGEIEGLEAELEEAEKQPPAADHNENKERNQRRMDKTINIRSLPMNTRAFDALPYNERESIVKREDVKTFLDRLR